MEPRGAKWSKNGAKTSKKSKWIAQDGPRQRQTAPKSRPGRPTRPIPERRRPKMEAQIDQNRWKKLFKNMFFDNVSYHFFFDFFIGTSMENWQKNDPKNILKTSRRKIPKMWKTCKNLMFFKVFWGSAGTEFAKKQSKNRWKNKLKSRSISEVIFKGFWSILGAILEAKIDQKTKKNVIKNKSDFKTMSYWRTTPIEPSS